jgi:hypothetical protein
MAYTTITDPSAYFQTALWTGDGSTPTITNDGNSDLQPDWLWGKNRTGTADNHYLIDSTRGTNKYVFSNSNSAEITNAAISSFNSDGFTLTSDVGLNRSGSTYVGWQWKANGGTTASNTDGSITSTVQANTTAGFSIVTYTGNNTGGATIGHGLGVAPKVVFTKTRAIADNWLVYHEGIGATKYLTLNTTSASATSTGAWNDTAPSSTVVTLGSFDNSNDNDNMVAYCFAEIQGYSEFSSYTGNGNADGPFVYTGFKPTWVMIKNTIAGEDWLIWDVKRDTANAPGNPMTGRLKANDTIAEVNGNDIDFLSNGFKIRTDSGYGNGSGNTIIYMAFAENPFVATNGLPTTAR